MRAIKERKPIFDDDAKYIAGFFDGEGCIQIYSRGTIQARAKSFPYNMRLSISNTHEGIMRWIKDCCGGSVYVSDQPRGNRAKAWKWSVSCGDAAYVLKAIYPYLRIKREQADVALEFQHIVSTSKCRTYKGRHGQPPLSEDDINLRESLAVKIRAIRLRDKQYH